MRKPTPTRKNYACPMRRLSTSTLLRLPDPRLVAQWSSQQFVSALRHDQKSAAYNRSVRQLLHVGFKVAAKMGTRYLDLLTEMETTIAKNVTENLYERHIKPVFIGA